MACWGRRGDVCLAVTPSLDLHATQVNVRSNMSPVSLLLLLLLLLRLLGSSGVGLGSVVTKQYKYFTDLRTWEDAQGHCRTHGYGGLATIHSEADLDQVLAGGFYAWVGLRRRSAGWTWSDEQMNSLNNWGSEPHNNHDRVVIFSKDKRFYGRSQKSRDFFICQTLADGAYDYKLIAQAKTWSEAQDYCRDHFQDLAVTNDLPSVNAAVQQRDFPVWVGLHTDGHGWRWTLGWSGYGRWAAEQPSNGSECGEVWALSGALSSQHCSQAHRPFLCLRENVVLLKEARTWEEAQDRCWALGYRLLSVQPGDDLDKVRGYVLAADTPKVWTGLRFLAGRWFWSDGATVSEDGLPQCPSATQRCGALAQSGAGGLETLDCSHQLNFLCYSSP